MLDVVGEEFLFQTRDADVVEALVRHGATGTEERLPLSKDDILQRGFLTPGGVVFEMTNDVKSTAAIRWWPEGADAATTLWEKTDDRDGGTIAVIGSTLYLSDVTPTASCILEMDLSAADPAATEQPVECAEQGLYLDPSTDGTTLAWLEGGPGGEDCRTLVRPSGSEPERLHVDGCIDRGTASATIAAWSERPVADDEGGLNYSAVVMKAAHAGATVDLGDGVSGSAVVCHGRVLWEVEGDVPAPEVRSWRPGTEPEVLYRAPMLDAKGRELGSFIHGITCIDESSVGFHLVTGSGERSMEFLVGALP